MSILDEIERVRAYLARNRRVSLRVLKREFGIDDDALEELVEELVEIQQVAAREGKALSWIGSAPADAPAPEPLPQAAPRTPPEPPPDAQALDGERRQLTVVFCDLVGSTELAAGLDPEDWREIVRGYQKTAAREFEGLGGHVAQYLGDGLLVYFGYPAAHEDDAERAVRSGLAVADAVQEANPTLRARHDVELAVRIGIHTGPVVVGEMGAGESRETLAMGDTTNVAARLQGLAEPDAVVLSAATLRLVQGVFVTRDLGNCALKGVGEVHAFRALRPSGMRSRLDVAAAADLTPLVGRDQELGLLEDRFAQVCEGWGQVVLISGEAGIGKSRLVQAFRERLAERPHTWLECRASPYTQDSALYPVIDLLRQALGFRPEDPPEGKLARLESGLANAGFERGPAIPLMARFLGLPSPTGHPDPMLSPEGQRKQTLSVLAEWLLRLGQLQPAVLLMEDLHWLDPSSLELLGSIVEQIPQARLMLLAAHRPDFESPWGARSHITPMLLSRMTRPQLTDLVRKAAERRELPEAWVEEIVRRSDGVPLFAEELTRTVVESNRGTPSTGQAPHLRIPQTLQDSLMARLDSLGPVKELAQVGAVLGREFSYDLLLKVSPMREAALRSALEQAVREELFYQRGAPPEATFLFKHALIRDAAYQSLLRAARQSHHRRVADTLMDRMPEVSTAQPELVAHHLTEAGAAERAILWWERAGERANARIAHQEAIRHLRRALALLAEQPDGAERAERQLDALLQLGIALVATHGYAHGETLGAYEQAEALCKVVQDATRRVPALHGLCTFHETSGNLDEAESHAATLLALGRESGDPEPTLLGENALTVVSLHRGSFAQTLEHARTVEAVYDPSSAERLLGLYASEIGLNTRCWVSWALWALGSPDRAAEEADGAADRARALGHPFTQAFHLGLASGVHQMRGDRARCQALADELVALSDTHGFPLWLGVGGFLGGWARGDLAAAREGVGMAASTGNQALSPYILAYLAEAAREAGEPEEARRAVGGALAQAERSGMHFWDAELQRLRGELALALGSEGEGEAEDCLERSLAIARAQQARSLELRAAVSLARLRRQQGRPQEGLTLLRPLYESFTEGLDTGDLTDAETLMEELA